MKLYILRRYGVTHLDEYDSFVVSAKDSKEARSLVFQRDRNDYWLNSRQSSCEQLKAEKKGIVISSFNAA